MALLERLRIYLRWRKPKDWLSPSKQRPNYPIDDKTMRKFMDFLLSPEGKALLRKDGDKMPHWRTET
jgi:hypothetical protein